MTSSQPPTYVALGDSMSIDLYPRLELQERGAIGPDESGVGAASLLYRNHDALWPEFAGRDLVSRVEGIALVNRCVDGATIGHTLDYQLPGVPDPVREAATVVTLTAGGNDLLGGIFGGLAAIAEQARRTSARYPWLIDRVLEIFPSARVLLTTVYDPTDGSGVLPGVSETLGPLPIEHLDAFNDTVRAVAGRHDRALLCDVHARFHGHGQAAAGDDDHWYWDPSPIEPGARGASEIRRVWLEALEVGAPGKTTSPPAAQRGSGPPSDPGPSRPGRA
jgi:lysophospholipase L1-like esterase